MNPIATPPIDAALVRQLVASQFPAWAELAIEPVARGGWCNAAFHLGSEMVVRLPRQQAYAEQTLKEADWLPKLAPLVPLALPQVFAVGSPSSHYPWHWSVCGWIAGETAEPSRIANLSRFAGDLGRFLVALQQIETADGPSPGPHNFFRGAELATYSSQTQSAIDRLGSKIDEALARAVWVVALASTWRGDPVWLHGDVAVGNLLVRDGLLCAVIDFGNMAVGDPACDLAVAWTLFGGESRAEFRSCIHLDDATWVRARAWALWKALIIASGLSTSNAWEAQRAWSIIAEVLADHKRSISATLSRQRP